MNIYIYEDGRLVHEKYNNIYDSDYVNFGYFYTNGKLDYAGFVDSEVYFYYDFDSNDNKFQEENSTGVTVFTYDNKKNPFINLLSNMKKIFVCNKIAEELGITYRGQLDLFLNTNKNNIIKINRYNNNSTSYEYVYENEYDDEGYLLKTTSPGVFNEIYTIEYYE